MGHHYIRTLFGDSMNDVLTAVYQKKANAIARKAGYGRATKIVLGDEDRIIERTCPGYRKNTTDEYVSNAYRSNFGWKNTYYQAAKTIVMIKTNY